MHRGAACVFLLAAALLAATWERLFHDPDTHWHVAVGRLIWERRAVPWTDTYSHTFAGAPWIAKEWLSQLLLYAAHRAAGWGGVAVVTGGAIAAALALLFARMRTRLAVVPAVGVVAAAVVLTSGNFLARPHVFTFPILVLWTAALVDAVERRAAPPWAALPLMALWVNLHGSFTIGYVIAGVLAADAVAAAPPGRRRGAAARWAGFLLAAVAAGLLSPYGHRAMLVTATLFGSGEPLRYINEWQPLAFDDEGVVAVALLVASVAALARRPRANAFRIVLLLVLGWMMVRHTRFTCLFALVAPVVAVDPLLRLFPRRRATDLGARPLLPVPALAALGAATLGLALAASPRPDPSLTPDAALGAARAHGLSGPVYNDYNFGGFLIARGVRTFIDGRTDQLFLGGFFTEVRRAESSPDHRRFARLVDRHRVRWALVASKSRARRHLDALPDWRRVYADSVALVYARR